MIEVVAGLLTWPTLAAVVLAVALYALISWWSDQRSRSAPAAVPDRSGEVRVARTEGDRLVAEGEDPQDAARALVINLCWRCEGLVSGTVEFVQVGGRRYPIRIEGEGFRYRASVSWPLEAASADR
jgi:hypothetical protein